MTQQRYVNRRQFLGVTVATAGAMLTRGERRLGAASLVAPSNFPSTSHFWYRLQPAGLYIDSQRNNKAFVYAFGQNPCFRDNGAAGGGSTGKLLGDARNPVIVVTCTL